MVKAVFGGKSTPTAGFCAHFVFKEYITCGTIYIIYKQSIILQMKHNYLPSLLTLLGVLIFIPARAQLFVDTMQYSPSELVMDFFNGSCVDVMNVEFFGEPAQATFFEGSQSGLGVNAGIILTTGDAQLAVGPNDSDNASFGYGIQSPDSLLEMIANSNAIFDKAMLHFTFVPHTDSIGFKYVFGSEEYCEYVGSQFNDAFGFWLKGPGISGPFYGAANIATIDTGIYVTINNVNHLTYSGFFINNQPSVSGFLCGQNPAAGLTINTVQYDGMTTVLTASAQVVPDSVYEVWIGLGDVGDGIYDSGIFLSIESLCGDTTLRPVTNFGASIDGTTVSFQNHTKYATAWHWDFGDGTTSDERWPVHTYDNLNQLYTVTLIATNYCCADTTTSTVGVSATGEANGLDFKIYPTKIQDELVIEPSASNASGEITLTDISGQVVLRRSFSGKTVLPTGALPNGAYFLVINTSDKKSLVRKVIK